VEVSAHTRKLASALWEMSEKVSRVTEAQRGEVEALLKQRRDESEVRGCCPSLRVLARLLDIVVGSCLLARIMMLVSHRAV
jgi:hypothetical protein